MPASPNYVASGTIQPLCFVKLDPANNYSVLQCVANDPVIGVSQEGTRYAPNTPMDDGNAAVAGNPIQVFGIGDECQVIAGGTIAAGDYVQSDASGHAVTLVITAGMAAGVYYIAGRAEKAAVAGDKVRIVLSPEVYVK